MKKQILIPVIGIVLVLAAGVFFALKVIGQKSQTAVEKEATNIVLPVDQRPHLYLVPGQQAKAVNCRGSNLPKDTAIRMQVVYDTDGLQQGFFCEMAANLEGGKYDREQILGTCSKGVCKYDRNVEFGEVTSEIVTEENEYQVLTKFHLQKNLKGAVTLTSADKNYSLQIPAGAVTTATNFITMETTGLPAKIDGNVKYLLDQPIGFFADQPIELKKATLSVKIDNSPANVAVLGYESSSNSWKEYEAEFGSSAKEVIAQVDLLSSYVVIEKSI